MLLYSTVSHPFPKLVLRFVQTGHNVHWYLYILEQSDFDIVVLSFVYLTFPVLPSEPSVVPRQHIVSYQGLIGNFLCRPSELCTLRLEDCGASAHSTWWKDEQIFVIRNVQRISLPFSCLTFMFLIILLFFLHAHHSMFLFMLFKCYPLGCIVNASVYRKL